MKIGNVLIIFNRFQTLTIYRSDIGLDRDNRAPTPEQNVSEPHELSTTLAQISERYAEWSVQQQGDILRSLTQIANTLPQVILEPTVQRTRGRPRGALNGREPQSSTRRDPLSFELVENENRRTRRVMKEGIISGVVQL